MAAPGFPQRLVLSDFNHLYKQIWTCVIAGYRFWLNCGPVAAPGTPQRLYMSGDDWEEVHEFRLSLQERPVGYPRSEGEEDTASSDVRALTPARHPDAFLTYACLMLLHLLPTLKHD